MWRSRRGISKSARSRCGPIFAHPPLTFFSLHHSLVYFLQWSAPLEGVQKVVMFKKDSRALTVFLQTSESGRNKEDSTYLCRNEFEVAEM